MTSYIICRKRLGIKKSDIELLKKSVEDRKFEHFKSELLKILDKKEKEESGEEVSKAFFVQDLYKSMIDPLYMAKAGFPVGTIREWKGKKYKKLSEKKWVRVYDKETRGAKLAIAALRRKIDACTDSRELLNLVLANKDRFCDELGRPLPIVQELSKYVSAKNDKIEKLTGKKDYVDGNWGDPKNDIAFFLRNEHKKDLKDRGKVFETRDGHKYEIISNNGNKYEIERTSLTGDKKVFSVETMGYGKGFHISKLEESTKKKTLNAGKPSKKTPDTGKEKNYYATRNGVTTEEERKKQLKAASEEDKELINRLKTSDERKDILRIYVSKVASGDMETKRDKLHALCKDNVLNDIMDSIGKGYEPVENKKRNNHSDYFFRIKNENGTFSDGGAIDKNIFEFAKFMWQNRGNKTVKNAINGGGNGGGGDGGDEPPKENVKIDIKDFPEQFNKGKWKKQTKILMDFMNGTSGDSTVKSLYKKLGAMINNLPFKIAKPKRFSNGQFTVSCDRRTMKPVEQTLHLLDISDENENIRRDTCTKALHEIMHMIDFSCRDNKSSPDYLSNSDEEIVNAINNAKISDEEISELEEHFKDFRAQERKIIESLNEKASKIEELGRQYQSNEITTYEEYGKKYREIQSQWESERKKITELRAKNVEVSQYADILDALSGGNLHDDKGFGGHGKEYYRKESNKVNEIVANYAALLAIGSEYADRLKKKHPELAESVYNLYKKMLER